MNTLMALALSAAYYQQYVVTGAPDSNNLIVYEITQKGVYEIAGSPFLTAADNLYRGGGGDELIEVDPAGSYLYVLHDGLPNFGITLYSYSLTNGVPKALSVSPNGSHLACELSTDCVPPTMAVTYNRVLVSDPGTPALSGGILSWSSNHGVLTKMPTIELSMTSHPQAIQVDPAAKYAYVQYNSTGRLIAPDMVAIYDIINPGQFELVGIEPIVNGVHWVGQ